MNDWIEWVYTPEKPYPETLETIVQVMFRDGDEEDIELSVEHWHSSWFDPELEPENSSWHQDGSDFEIVAYRVVT